MNLHRILHLTESRHATVGKFGELTIIIITTAATMTITITMMAAASSISISCCTYLCFSCIRNALSRWRKPSANIHLVYLINFVQNLTIILALLRCSGVAYFYWLPSRLPCLANPLSFFSFVRSDSIEDRKSFRVFFVVGAAVDSACTTTMCYSSVMIVNYFSCYKFRSCRKKNSKSCMLSVPTTLFCTTRTCYDADRWVNLRLEKPRNC